MRASQQMLCASFAALALGLCGTATAAPSWHWVTSWGAAQQVPDPQNELPAAAWKDSSLRQIVRNSLDGKTLRVRVSNVHGTSPMAIDGASIARAVKPGTPDVDAASMRRLTFGGHGYVTIPAGAEYYSDSVELDVAAGTDLAITIAFKDLPARQTGHPGSRTTSFTLPGRQELVAGWPEAGKVPRWYALTDIEVQAPRSVGALVTIGDSITDGYGVAPDTNTRWPDFLAARLQKEGLKMGLVNTGIGGGRMLLDGSGPNMASRFERDVLGRNGVTHALVLIGVNDMGVLHRNGQDTPQARQQLMEDLKLAHRQLVERAHARGVCVIGGTVLPYAGSDYYKPAAANEADRKALNEWVRTSGVFDAVADFDALMRDPAAPDHLRKDVDNDGLHPSTAGYREMANAVPLAALRSCRINR